MVSGLFSVQRDFRPAVARRARTIPGSWLVVGGRTSLQAFPNRETTIFGVLGPGRAIGATVVMSEGIRLSPVVRGLCGLTAATTTFVAFTADFAGCGFAHLGFLCSLDTIGRLVHGRLSLCLPVSCYA